MTLISHILLVIIFIHGPKHLTSKSAKHFCLRLRYATGNDVMQLGMILSDSSLHLWITVQVCLRHGI